MLETRYGQLGATGAQSNAINLTEVPMALKQRAQYQLLQMHNRQHPHSIINLNRLKTRPRNDTEWVLIITFEACVFFTRVSSVIFIKVLTAVELLVSVHGGHLGVGDILEGGEEQNHFPFLILNWDDVE